MTSSSSPLLPAVDVADAETDFVGWCRNCSYPLHGLTASTRCPECGRPFDPRDPETIETRPPVGIVGRWFRRHPDVLEPLTLAAWFATVIVLAALWGFVTSGTLFMCGVPVAFIVAARVRAAARRKLVAGYGLPGQPDRNARLFRVVPWAFLGLFLLTTIHFQRCPHGTAVGALGVGVAYSEVGGPCRNTRKLTSKRVAGNWYVWVAM